jgi:citronellol/citronellal dehydrogenase
MSTQSLDGRVAIITGSSRGIGRALALRLADEGAAIVVTGKSEQGTDRLPGSIYTVAEEIRERGGVALPVRLDVRESEQVAAMVERTIAELGRVDILVNNAGALWWEPVLQTPPNRFDLMWQVNVRGAYLCSYHALPHMVSQNYGHIVMCSPPLVTSVSPGRVLYETTKMGMTRLALGIADEHRQDNVAANSLWPATLIESFATINWPAEIMGGGPEQWRSPEVLCDALVQVVTSDPSELTGRDLTDEEILRERGWNESELDRYWVAGERPAHPVWIDGRAHTA